MCIIHRNNYIHVVATNMQLSVKILKLQIRWATDMVRGFWR